MKEGEQWRKETELFLKKRQWASFSSGLRLACGDQHLCFKVNGLDKRCLTLRINRCKDKVSFWSNKVVAVQLLSHVWPFAGSKSDLARSWWSSLPASSLIKTQTLHTMPCPQCRLLRARVPWLFTGAQPLPSLLTTWSAQAHLIDYSPPRLPYPPLFSRICSNSCPLCQWCHPTISSSVAPSPALNLSEHQGLFHWVSSSHQMVKIWELQHQSPKEGP